MDRISPTTAIVCGVAYPRPSTGALADLLYLLQLKSVDRRRSLVNPRRRPADRPALVQLPAGGQLEAVAQFGHARLASAGHLGIHVGEGERRPMPGNDPSATPPKAARSESSRSSDRSDGSSLRPASAPHEQSLLVTDEGGARPPPPYQLDQRVCFSCRVSKVACCRIRITSRPVGCRPETRRTTPRAAPWPARSRTPAARTRPSAPAAPRRPPTEGTGECARPRGSPPPEGLSEAVRQQNPGTAPTTRQWSGTARVDRPPRTVESLHPVQHDHVRVQLRVRGAGVPMVERRRDHPRTSPDHPRPFPSGTRRRAARHTR